MWCGQSAAKDPVAAAVEEANRCPTRGILLHPTALCTDLASLLARFLEGERDARRDLPVVAGSDVRRLALVLAPATFCARHLVDDVVNRTWELLLRRGPGSYDSARGTPQAYIATVVRTAVRDVRQQNRFDVGPSRRYRGSELDPPAATPRTSLAWTDDIDLDGVLQSVLGSCPEALAAARLIAFEDATLTSAALAVGLTRFSLHRRFRALLDRHDFLAA